MKAESLPPAIFLMGPTASGKTGLAVELHETFPVDIISVDSALVYRGMDMGTAKPDAETLVRAPHRLVDICEPWEVYSAARFRDDALREMRDIASKGRVPLLVGGTMLYFRALLDGLSMLPPADEHTRYLLVKEADEVGWPAMHAKLAEVDPEAAERINPNDPQRIQRALEVIRLTGRKMTDLQADRRSEPLPYEVLRIVVCPGSRVELRRRIRQRFEIMLEEGFVNEVRALHANPSLHAGLPSMRAVGYRQAWGWLDGRLGDDEWQQKAVTATRQLAKRQLTWLRKEEGALWYDPDTDEGKEGIFREVRKYLKFHG
ncbi:MAG: tRNA (adenosine(37)-N6)-dimethylallyltransferase MiaA [Xanthomonadales bacterium]|nr:tRNA (adenosine(37)-N6)-dimethylallyltransferase MiaA [Xanthomonadales bacterium]NIX13597.1 tRNA (adenosine(37)-N6)-dimethylallyltransferase MiaA [Xanthomonadales bacterium]